jgi:hypothetical protein
MGSATSKNLQYCCVLFCTSAEFVSVPADAPVCLQILLGRSEKRQLGCRKGNTFSIAHFGDGGGELEPEQEAEPEGATKDAKAFWSELLPEAAAEHAARANHAKEPEVRATNPTEGSTWPWRQVLVVHVTVHHVASSTVSNFCTAAGVYATFQSPLSPATVNMYSRLRFAALVLLPCNRLCPAGAWPQAAQAGGLP